MVSGELLRVAEAAGFEVLVTTDANLPYQQNLTGRHLAIVVLGKNRWKLVNPAMTRIVAAIERVKPGSCTVVDIPG